MAHIKEILSAINLNERIQRLSESLDKLGTGALMAFGGGTLVLGWVAGGILWMPAAMSGSLLCYRLARFWLNRRDQKPQRDLQRWDSVMLRMMLLRATQLPDSDRRRLSAALNQQLETPYAPLLLARKDDAFVIEDVDKVSRLVETKEQDSVQEFIEERNRHEAATNKAKAHSESS